MQTYKFKTDIECPGCLKLITPTLNGLSNTEWQVELDDPDRTLLIRGLISSEQVLAVMEKAGFKATEKEN